MSTQLLTPEEVAGMLRVHPWTIYRWLRAKKLTGRKYGGVWRIPLQSVMQKREEKR